MLALWLLKTLSRLPTEKRHWQLLGDEIGGAHQSKDRLRRLRLNLWLSPLLKGGWRWMKSSHNAFNVTGVAFYYVPRCHVEWSMCAKHIILLFTPALCCGCDQFWWARSGRAAARRTFSLFLCALPSLFHTLTIHHFAIYFWLWQMIFIYMRRVEIFVCAMKWDEKQKQSDEKS